MADAARLFVDADLTPEAEIALDEAAAHYLRHVLRLGQGARLKLFNGRDGEFAAHIAALPKRGAVLAVESRMRPFQAAPDIWLCFAPLRQGRMETLIEKAT
jgi:16S rRNA (uracil1498-N3)-methyltransferase